MSVVSWIDLVSNFPGIKISTKLDTYFGNVEGPRAKVSLYSPAIESTLCENLQKGINWSIQSNGYEMDCDK